MKKMMNLAILVFLGISMFAVETSAQCVQCKPSRVRDGGLSCQSSSSGGQECQGGGAACAIVGVCRGSRVTQTTSEAETKGLGIVQVDDAILREIAAKHPRFAIAFSLVAKSGYIGREGVKVSVVPVELTKEDFETWLTFEHERNSNPLKDFGGFSQKLNQPNETISPVSYLLSAEKATESTATIRLDVEEAFSSDPAFSSLEVTLVRTKGNASENGTWKVEKWQLR